MTEKESETAVPWKDLPVSEAVLAGDYSREVHREKGWTIWYPAMLTVIAGISTQEAHRLLSAGAVTIDGGVAADGFGYIKPGALVSIKGVGRFRISQIEPSKY